VDGLDERLALEAGYIRDGLAQVREGERVLLSTWIDKWTAVTSERHTRITKVESGVEVIRAKTTWAMIDFATGRPRRVPKEIRDAFLGARFAPPGQ